MSMASILARLERIERKLNLDRTMSVPRNAPVFVGAGNVVQFSADNTQQRTSSALDLVSQVASIIRGLQERAAETEARARA
jgi:hypothetical protein